MIGSILGIQKRGRNVGDEEDDEFSVGPQGILPR
jgi:hypothetical protein